MIHPHSEDLVYEAVLSGELEIDQQGKVWRIKKRTADRWTGGVKVTPCRRVRAEIGKDGDYLQVRVMRDKKRHCAAAHRLVWRHFNGPIPDGLTVNHKHGMKSDNRPEELELATYREQRRHALDVLEVPTWKPKGSLHPKTKIDEVDVKRMRELRAAGAKVRDIAATYAMNPKAVSAICRRRTWPHVI